MKYAYNAVFNPIEDGSGYYCSIPDLPGCISTGKDVDDAIEMITDAASIWLVGAEDDGDTIPSPSTQDALSHDPGGFVSVIRVDTINYRSAIDTRSVRKSVSLPAWLSHLADQRRVNCSQLLQEALISRLDA